MAIKVDSWLGHFTTHCIESQIFIVLNQFGLLSAKVLGEKLLQKWCMVMQRTRVGAYNVSYIRVCYRDSCVGADNYLG